MNEKKWENDGREWERKEKLKIVKKDSPMAMGVE